MAVLASPSPEPPCQSTFFTQESKADLSRVKQIYHVKCRDSIQDDKAGKSAWRLAAIDVPLSSQITTPEEWFTPIN